jgi:hypothetical protein
MGAVGVTKGHQGAEMGRKDDEQFVTADTTGSETGSSAARNRSKEALLGAGDIRASSSRFEAQSGTVGSSEMF